MKAALIPYAGRDKREAPLTPSPQHIGWLARQLFERGRDTLSIAHELGVRESVVANALARIRDRDRRK